MMMPASDRLRFIRNGRLLGLSLDDIRELLAAADGGCPGEQPIYNEKLAGHLKAIDERIGYFVALRTAVEKLITSARGR